MIRDASGEQWGALSVRHMPRERRLEELLLEPIGAWVQSPFARFHKGYEGEKVTYSVSLPDNAGKAHNGN